MLKTIRGSCAWMLLILCLCSCDHEAGGVSEPVAVSVVAPPTEYVDVYANPEPGLLGYDLAVMVQSNSGFPLAGAWVQLVVDDGAGYTTLQANTDEWGEAFFCFYATPGTWVFIDACSTGFACSAVDLVTGGEPAMDVSLYLAPVMVGMPP